MQIGSIDCQQKQQGSSVGERKIFSVNGAGTIGHQLQNNDS